MGALGHYIEREGVPTAQISLIREQTAAAKPPRALWVPFMLGRPFGAPNEPEFQRKVLRALLSLFEHPAGPILMDFPLEAPASDAPASGFACPVSFAAATAKEGELAEAMRREIAQLAPWYDLAVRRRGRTTVGISGLRVEEAASHAASYLDGAPRPAAAKVFLAIQQVCAKSADASLQPLGKLSLVPRAVSHALSTDRKEMT